MTPYERPFRPVELDDSELRKFPIAAMVEQLRGENTLDESGRASLTLVHGPGLTAVLTVARAGTVFEQHQAGGPTVFVLLSGQMSVVPLSNNGPVALTELDAFALGPEVRHVLEVRADAAFLTIIGEQSEKPT